MNGKFVALSIILILTAIVLLSLGISDNTSPKASNYFLSSGLLFLGGCLSFVAAVLSDITNYKQKTVSVN